MSFIDRLFGYGELATSGIVLDVGTEFVKALVFKVENGKAYILGATKVRQDLKDMQGGAITDIAGVIDNCMEALEKACGLANITPHQVIMGIAGELVKGATSTISYERKSPDKKIDQKELKNIVHKVQEKAFGQIRAQISLETGKEDIDVRMVNSAIVDVHIDRHPVSNPIGFTGKSVRVGVYNAFAPMVYLGALENVAEKLGLDLMGVAAEPYAIAKSVGIEQGKDFSAIFMDIGGGTTDVALVRSGGLEGTKIFSIGGRAFTKRIARELDISFAQAEELKLSYSEGELDKEKREKIGRILKEDVGVWLSGVKMVLEEFGDNESLPGRILLCGGGSLLPEIKKHLEEPSWHENLAFSKNPTVEFVKPGDVNSVVDETGSLDSPLDITSLALAHLSIELIEDTNILAGMLRRASDSLNN